MRLKTACRLFSVSYAQMLKLCKKGWFCAFKKKGRRRAQGGQGQEWVLGQPPTRQKAYKISVVAEVLDCSQERVRQLCREGRIETIRIGNSWRVTKDEVVSLIMRRVGPVHVGVNAVDMETL